jgi:hypothetical protein
MQGNSDALFAVLPKLLLFIVDANKHTADTSSAVNI